MNTPLQLPLLIEPHRLLAQLDDPRIRVVDLSPAEVFREHHAPGAVHLPYGQLVAARPPVGGLLPETEVLTRVLDAAGIGAQHHVVALDAEGGGAAGRLIWTLDALGHGAASLVDGGLHAWVNEGMPVETGAGTDVEPGGFRAHPTHANVIDAEGIMAWLDDDTFVALDARSGGEYAGTDVRAARGGHIPGAVHFEWTRGMDRDRNLRLRPSEALIDELAELGVTPDRTVAVYCHTHHRSAFSYVMLRILGFRHVLGNLGSWSDWGNRDDTPVE